MSELEACSGIFIQSNESNEEFIIACIKELQPICNSPIKRVAPGNTGNGIRIYFEDDKAVSTVLSRKTLVVSGQKYDMCPLVTHLTIHHVVPNTQHNVEKDLSAKMNHSLGPVLKIYELKLRSEEFPVPKSDWRVIIEIPEFKALEKFQNRIKFKKRNEKNIEYFYTEAGLKLSIFCPKCEKDGHISQRCKTQIMPTVKKSSAQKIPSNTSFQKNAVASTSTASNVRGQTFRETVCQPREQCNTSMDRTSKRKSEDVQNTLEAPSCSQRAISPPTRNIHPSVTDKSESRNPQRNSVIREIKILPNSRTEECIQKAGGACRLSQPQLEIFFNHVKGKKDIRRILKMYKNMHKISEKALEEQLKEIVRLYYVSKLPETKEDKSLIRWLECLVERLNKKSRKFKKRSPAKSHKEKPKDT